MPIDLLRNSGKVSQLCLCIWHIMCTPERQVRVLNTRFGLCRWSAGGFMSAGRVSFLLSVAFPWISQTAEAFPAPEQHYAPPALSDQHLHLVSDAVPDSKQGIPRPVWHITAGSFITQLWFSIAVEHETWCAAATQTPRPWIFRQTVHLHPGAQIMLEINLVQLLPDRAEGLAVSRRTRWNVPPVYPAFSYCKPLPTNGFLLWTTKLNIVHCVYVFRLLSSSLWSVETARFL